MKYAKNATVAMLRLAPVLFFFPFFFATNPALGQDAVSPELDAASSINGMCAAACAFAILKHEHRPELTPQQLITELPGAAQGSVRLRDLVDFLSHHGFVTRVIAGMTPDDLGRMPAGGGVYTLPLTASGRSGPDYPVDHIALFLKQSDDGSYLFADTDRVVERSEAFLAEKWQEGYALMAGLDEGQVKAVITSMASKKPNPILLYGVVGVGLVLLFRLWRYRLRKRDITGSVEKARIDH